MTPADVADAGRNVAQCSRRRTGHCLREFSMSWPKASPELRGAVPPPKLVEQLVGILRRRGALEPAVDILPVAPANLVDLAGLVGRREGGSGPVGAAPRHLR